MGTLAWIGVVLGAWCLVSLLAAVLYAWARTRLNRGRRPRGHPAPPRAVPPPRARPAVRPPWPGRLLRRWRA